ncbi:protoporphyrinogen oxidase [Cytobacillus suaedae]|nr:protoporphyrinogen oxidase [Cytobacillus suaedae]
MKTILVVGGGVTGLSAMHELHKWKKESKSDVRLILSEASEALGGKIRTVSDNGFVMETGADSIVARKANTMTFIKDLGLENEVVYNATGRSFIYVDGELKSIPDDSIFGIPMSIESLAKSTLISAEGKVEALKDLYTKNESFTKNDSVGSFLEFCFGKELVEKQIGPVLSGVYSGTLADLTIASTLPYLIDYKNEFGSVIKGFEANKAKFQNASGGQKFISFDTGMNALIDAYENTFEDVEVLKNHPVTAIDKADEGYRVTFANGEVVVVDHIILSIPHTVASELLTEPSLKQPFSELENGSLLSVYVAFDVPDSNLPAEGTGFITAKNDELSCNACTWTSRKWKHTSESGNLLVRLFYKSSHPSFESLKEMNEDELLRVALADISKSLGITAEPVSSEITDWSNTMPTYQITHPKTVEVLENKLADSYPGILLAGCSYYGVGIPDCIENGQISAHKIIEQL